MFQSCLQFCVDLFRCSIVIVFFQIDPLEMHGGKYSVYLFHLGPDYKIDSPYIIAVMVTGIEQGVKVIINIFFKAIIVFRRNPSEARLGETVMDQFVHILRKFQKRCDFIQVFSEGISGVSQFLKFLLYL